MAAGRQEKVQVAVKAGHRVRAEKAASVVSVRQLSHAAKVRKLLPLKAAVTSPKKKAASLTSIAKMLIGKL